ncbi:MAG: DUF305 domain-containing protein [Cyanobacteria bacterium SZAS LIN-2]|nr:DUF305 domain-containing protein [Cyanobacteria bacterium SZAS LIN-2]
MSSFPVRKAKICAPARTTHACATGLIAVLLLAFAPIPSRSQASGGPSVVQPGAPGEPTKTLPNDTHATLPPISRADVDFMQGMIMHHSQAVEMTALIQSHTENKNVRAMGAKISSSQADEIRMMQRWLAARGQATSMEMPGMPGMDMGGKAMAPMPGMLTPDQMTALKHATGTEFDRLFLSGMIQHHGGALVMVKDLFNSAGAGQDAEIFDFATDVDNSQRAEIKIMQKYLEELH